MTLQETAALLLGTFLLVFGGCAGTAEEPGGTALTLDCSTPTMGLLEEEAVIGHRAGHELHAWWLIADQPELWQRALSVPELLERYRDTVREIVPDVSPLGLIRANRETYPWLEREHPAVGRINRMVEAGVGSHRPMSCLEARILAFQTARFPLYEQPTEIVALILARAEARGDVLKVYVAADDDTVVPKPDVAVARAETDVAAGWRFVAVFHNHTFKHDPERGHLPVAAPSASDLQISASLVKRLGLESILVADGFSTLELTADEILLLAEAASEESGEANAEGES